MSKQWFASIVQCFEDIRWRKETTGLVPKKSRSNIDLPNGDDQVDQREFLADQYYQAIK